MPRKFFFIFTPLISFMLSCSNNKTESTGDSVASESLRPKGLDRYEGGYKMVQDEETGFMKPVSTKEGSPFSDKTSPFTAKNGNFNKEFSTPQYDARRWEGAEKKKSRMPWSRGKEDFEYSPQFVKDNAEIANKKPSEKGKSFTRSSYETSSAREQGSSRIETMPNYVIQKKQEGFIQPEIISNKSYHEKGRSVEEVKSLLGN